jgi:hypothetical protein
MIFFLSEFFPATSLPRGAGCTVNAASGMLRYVLPLGVTAPLL